MSYRRMSQRPAGRARVFVAGSCRIRALGTCVGVIRFCSHAGVNMGTSTGRSRFIKVRTGVGGWVA